MQAESSLHSFHAGQVFVTDLSHRRSVRYILVTQAECSLQTYHTGEVFVLLISCSQSVRCILVTHAKCLHAGKDFVTFLSRISLSRRETVAVKPACPVCRPKR